MTDTYGEAFEFDIHNILKEGDLSRRGLFRWWLGEGTVFFCRHCKEECETNPDVDEDDEILCAVCRGQSHEEL